MLTPVMLQEPVIATPHEGELARLEQAFGESGAGGKVERALAMARHLGTVIAKGPTR
jgi:NAD(P)H-hydrate repair Nnr-like enzyme with NAD(P)H-hydrate dehydratase domain